MDKPSRKNGREVGDKDNDYSSKSTGLKILLKRKDESSPIIKRVCIEENTPINSTYENIKNKNTGENGDSYRKEQQGELTSDSHPVVCSSNSNDILLYSTRKSIPTNIKEINVILTKALKSFNEDNSLVVCRIIEKYAFNEENSVEILAFLRLLKELTVSPYFHFVKCPLRNLLLKPLNSNCKVPKEIKLFCFEILVTSYEPVELFHSLLCIYPSVDSIRIGSSSFRNFILLKCITQAALQDTKEYLNKTETTDNHNNSSIRKKRTVFEPVNILSCAQDISNCLPFVEFLTRNLNSDIPRYFLLFICYDFLKNIKVDLLSMKLNDIPKDLDDSVITKVFGSLADIKTAFEKSGEKFTIGPIKAKKCRTELHQNNSELALTHSPNFDLHGTSNDMVETVDHSNSLGKDLGRFIQDLFGSDSLRSIILSIYKRLFFYFLFKNKRLFQSGKVFNIFSKEERHFIYKQIKSHQSSFINIFKQIGQQYLIKEAQKSHLIGLPLLLSINQEKISLEDLPIFYRMCLSHVDYARETLTLKIHSPEIFCREFNCLLDKSIARHLDIQWGGNADLNSIEIASFLEVLSSQVESTKLVDPIEMVSYVTDKPLNSTRLENTLLVLKILFNIRNYLSIPLVKRLIPMLRKLILFSNLTLYSGRLYHGIYSMFKMVDSIFTNNISLKTEDGLDTSLLIKASLNNSTFEGSFESIIDSLRNKKSGETEYEEIADLVGTLPPFQNSLISNSLIFYLYHNPSYSFQYSSILFNTLAAKNQSTKYLLEYLKGSLDSGSLFVVEILASLYDLYFHVEIVGNSVLSPFVSDILEILFKALKSKVVLPCMVIPYILPLSDCSFIYKNYLDSCLNCINDCLYVVSSSIKSDIKKLKSKEENASNIPKKEDESKEGESIIDVQECPSYINESLLNAVFLNKAKNNFIYTLSLKVPLKKILEKLDYNEDTLTVFIVLRQLKCFNKSDKETLFSHVMENVSDESILDLIVKSKEFFEKSPRGELPVSFIG